MVPMPSGPAGAGPRVYCVSLEAYTWPARALWNTVSQDFFAHHGINAVFHVQDAGDEAAGRADIVPNVPGSHGLGRIGVGEAGAIGKGLATELVDPGFGGDAGDADLALTLALGDGNCPVRYCSQVMASISAPSGR